MHLLTDHAPHVVSPPLNYSVSAMVRDFRRVYGSAVDSPISILQQHVYPAGTRLWDYAGPAADKGSSIAELQEERRSRRAIPVLSRNRK